MDANARSPQPAARSLPVVTGPQKAAKPGWQRAIEVGLRSLHIVAMGLVLGGIAAGGTYATLRPFIFATLGTGALLLLTCVRWGCLHFTQGAGAAVLLKLALLGLGNVVEEARLPCYAAATLVTSVGSHMPSAWRHFPVLGWARSLVGLGPRVA
jgi:hypothetical protein